LYTTSAALTVNRIIDLFPSAEKDMVRSMLSDSLRAVVTQSLMKRRVGGQIPAHEIMIGTPAIGDLREKTRWPRYIRSFKQGLNLE
jgi:twitching motility protein PilT